MGQGTSWEQAVAAVTGSGAHYAIAETEIDGRPWGQKPFPYQRKCLGWLRESYAKLAPTDRNIADGVLADTGCEALFA